MIDSKQDINKFALDNIDKPLVNSNYLEQRISLLEDKVNLILERLDLTLKSNARLRVHLKEIVKEAVKSAVNMHSTEDYSSITA